MDGQAVLEWAHKLGITLKAAGDRIRYRPKSAAPPDFVESLQQHKAEILAILSGQPTTWPPPDAADLLARWKELGRPEIPLSTGMTITDLDRWLYPSHGLPVWKPEELPSIRGYLVEHLPPGKVPQTNSVMEEWRRTSIPAWRGKLKAAMKEGRKGDEEYARWMLREVLLDPEHQEPEV